MALLGLYIYKYKIPNFVRRIRHLSRRWIRNPQSYIKRTGDWRLETFPSPSNQHPVPIFTAYCISRNGVNLRFSYRFEDPRKNMKSKISVFSGLRTAYSLPSSFLVLRIRLSGEGGILNPSCPPILPLREF